MLTIYQVNFLRNHNYNKKEYLRIAKEILAEGFTSKVWSENDPNELRRIEDFMRAKYRLDFGTDDLDLVLYDAESDSYIIVE